MATSLIKQEPLNNQTVDFYSFFLIKNNFAIKIMHYNTK
jgi:hypothetical protein